MSKECFYKEFRIKISARVCAECPSLAEARVFMERHRFEGAALEELANAIQAEAILCVDDHQANLALEAEGVILSDLTPEPTDDKTRNSCVGDPRAGLALEADPTDNTAFPRELADVNEAKATTCVDDPRAGLAPGAEGVTWSEFTPEPTDNTAFPRGLAEVIEAKANKCVDDGTELASEAVAKLTTQTKMKTPSWPAPN
jgi:hypothetical protein